MDSNFERLEIRKIITEIGFKYYLKLGEKSLNLKHIAGEFMALNEDYVLNKKGTVGTHSILTTGFTENQKILLDALSRELK